MSKSLDEITLSVEALAQARANLAILVHALNEGIELLKADKLPELRACIDVAQKAWSAVEADIRQSPDEFVKPRTVVAHGIKFGLKKGAGAIEIPDPDKTVALIEKHFPDQAEILVDTKKVPAKAAIAQLPAADLKRIGCQVKDAGDQVVIAPADGAIDKLVKALIKSAIEDESAEAS